MDGHSSDDLDKSLAVVTEHTALRKVAISEAAAKRLVAWDTDQRVRALHESGHVIVGTALGFPVKCADIRGQHYGFTETGESDDDQPQTTTGSRMFDRIVMLLAGQAAEKLLIGEGTDGSIHDLTSATSMAMMRINAGLDARAPFISIDGFSHSRPPEAIWDAIGAAVLQALTEARDRADALAAEHRDHIIAFAQALHDARRLTDDALAAAVRESAPK